MLTKYLPSLFEVTNLKQLEHLRRQIAKENQVKLPTNRELLTLYRSATNQTKTGDHTKLLQLLTTRKVRTLSGVAPVTVLTKPYPCPGRCVYCPTEPGMPKSYLASQPAGSRAKANAFKPLRQVTTRLKMYHDNGHPTDKIELIILGGTWSYYPKGYQTSFIRSLYNACNNFGGQASGSSLKEAQEINQTAKNRVIGLTLETRPDWITVPEIKRLRRFGVTRVEMGVQSIDNKILSLTKRDHQAKEIKEATKLLKQAGFKIVYHLMPGLPGATPEKDIEVFKEIFAKADYQPDQIKIYPCLVLKNSVLHRWWKAGKFKPYTEKQLTYTLTKIKKNLPAWVRVERVYRDIPAPDIKKGSKKTNYREIIQAQLKKDGTPCQCIRCREIKDQSLPLNQLFLNQTTYGSEKFKDIFLSYTSQDQATLAAFARLSLPSLTRRPILPSLKKAALLRELHTYGQMISLNSSTNQATQHLGLGKKLIKESEKLSIKAGYQYLAIISGVGVREYYRKQGYQLNIDGYMVKKLT